jgi:hypothetical protein
LPGSQIAQCEKKRGSSPKSVTAQGAAREAGGRVKPMAQAVGIGCERSPSPRSGRKIQARAGDFSVPKRLLFAAEGSRRRPSALGTDSERREPHSFARFAGFTTLTLCPPHGLRHGLSSIARFAGSVQFPPDSQGWRPGLVAAATRPPSGAWGPQKENGSSHKPFTLLGEEPKKRVTSDELNNSSLVTRHSSLVTVFWQPAAGSSPAPTARSWTPH